MAKEDNKKEYGNVVLPLAEYNELRDKYNAALVEINELENVINELQENPKQKVFVKEVEIEDEWVTTNYRIKGFKEVKEDVEKVFGKKIEELEAQNKELQELCKKYADELIEEQMKVSDLRNRSLWQRILNK